jgi:hypothetical protein
MIDRIIKSNILLPAIIFICAVFTFGGAVNLGWSGFAMAVPFMVLWGVTAYKAGSKTIIVSLLIFLMILPFYILRKNESYIFFPANGQEIVLNQDACFKVFTNKYDPPYEDFILASSLTDEPNCLNAKYHMSDIKKTKLVSKGTKYIIEKTEVSHADMGEHFLATVKDSDGKLSIFKPNLFSYTDGKPLTEDTLKNPYFYYPSLLMYGPILPLSLFSLFSPRV